MPSSKFYLMLSKNRDLILLHTVLTTRQVRLIGIRRLDRGDYQVHVDHEGSMSAIRKIYIEAYSKYSFPIPKEFLEDMIAKV